MASIHIGEIEGYLQQRDGQEYERGTVIQFGDPNETGGGVVDDNRRNMLMSLQCAYGSIVLAFDDKGQLEYLELS